MFVVRVADNFHYMDDDETFTHGEFATWPEAIAAARQLVDRYLAAAFRPGMTSAALYDGYTSFGDDPYIVPVLDGERFSAWEYAKHRCEAMCEAQRTQGAEPGAAADGGA